MSTENPGSALPAAVQRLWETPQPGRRGPKPALSVERIVAAAVEIADAEGLTAVSMARVADRLGYTPMALYRHISGKDELLAQMTDAIVPDPPELRPGAGWRAYLEVWVRAQIEMIDARPWYLDLPVAASVPGPRRLHWIDRALGALEELDLSPDEKFAIIGMLATHVLGEGTARVSTRRAALASVRASGDVPDGTPDEELDPDAVRAADPYADFGALLARVARPADYPAVFRLFSSTGTPTMTGPGVAAADHEDGGGLDDVAFSVGVLLDGIEAYVARKR